MTNGQRRSFQLLNSDNRSIANATFEAATIVEQLSSLSLSELDVRLFHAGCRNIILCAKRLAEAEQEAAELIAAQRAAIA